MSLKHDLIMLSEALKTARAKCDPAQLSGFDIAVLAVALSYQRMRPGFDLALFLKNCGLPPLR